MKKLLTLAALTFLIAFNLGCEQQSWDQTKLFHQNPRAHGEHGHASAPAARGTEHP